MYDYEKVVYGFLPFLMLSLCGFTMHVQAGEYAYTGIVMRDLPIYTAANDKSAFQSHKKHVINE